MITLKKKETTVEALDKALAGAGSVFVTDFAGIKVGADNGLRKELRRNGVFFRVAKNTLVRRSLNKAGITALDSYLKGPTAILVGSEDDPVAPARAIVEFQKANAGLLGSKVTYLGGDVLGGKAIEDISKMPGKREIQGQIVSLFLSPGSNVVGLIKGPGSKIAGAVEALVKRLEEAGEA